MGSLEDAIREHLELKRLRGADPAEVAREQREALDPPAGQAPSALAEDQTATVDDDANAAEGHLPLDGQSSGEHPVEAPHVADVGDPPNSAQETAELDMQAVLEDEATAPSEHDAPAGPAAAESGPSAEPNEEDSLEWEVPARSSGDVAGSGDQPDENHTAASGGAPGHGSADGHERGSDAEHRAPEQPRMSF
jgi:hypothetical protein